jgi:hypothetical protein
MNVARTTRSRAPSQPLASLLAAPPAKIRVRAMRVGRSAPLIFNRKGRNVRNPMRAALSVVAIASSSEKPRPIGAHGATRGLRPASRIFATRPGKPRTARIATAAASPPTLIVAVAARHGIKINSQAVIAGSAILPG